MIVSASTLSKSLSRLTFPRFDTLSLRHCHYYAPHRLISSSSIQSLAFQMSSSMTATTTPDIEELHRQAVQQGSTIYHDPSTGFSVFTELAHLKRGKCCGNKCRHCPYGWELVPPPPPTGNDTNRQQQHNKGNDIIRSAKVKSGDTQAIQQLLQSLNGSSLQARNMSTTSSSSSPTTTTTTAKTKTGGRHGGRFTDKNVPYTRVGDQGTSQLLTGERRSKDDVAFEAMGTVDELCAVVGVAHSEYMRSNSSNGGEDDDVNSPIQMNTWLLEIMSRLFDIGSHVAKPRKVDQDFVADGIGGGFDEHHVQELEDWIDLLTEALPELTSFILPTGAVAGAQLHAARTVCRRAERTVIPLVVRNDGSPALCDPNALKYLNRLSDFLFAAARYVNLQQQHEEVTYRRPTKNAKQRTRVKVSLHADDGTTGGTK